MAQVIFAQSLDDAKKNLYYQKYTTAKQQLQQMASSKPQAETYYYLGLADMGMADYKAAKADFDKGLQTDGSSALNMVGEGAIAIHDKQYDAAKQQFQKAFDATKGRDFDVVRAILKATAQDPAMDEQFALGLLKQFQDDKKNRKYDYKPEDYVAIGDVYANTPSGGGQAVTNYENAVTADQNYAGAYYATGNLWDRARQDSLARMNWEKSVAVDANYGPGFYALFAYYRDQIYQTLNREDAQKAEEYLNKYMALTDDKVNSQINLVDIQFMQGKFSDAVSQAQGLMDKLTNEETKTRLYKLMALSQLKMGDSTAAKQSMDTYFQRQDTSKVLGFDYQLYSDILFKLNDQEKGNEYLQKAVDRDTSSDLSYIRQQAETLRNKNNWKGAALWYKKAIDVNKGAPSSFDYFYYAYSKYVAQDYPAAEAAFGEMTKKMPEQTSGYYYLGLSQAAQDTAYTGKPIEAFNTYLEKVKTDTAAQKSDKTSQLRKIYTYFGAYYVNKGDYPKAAEYADKLLAEVDPKSPEAQSILYNIAAYYTKQKDRDNAMTYINKMQSVDPNSEGAKTLADYWKQMDEYQKKMQDYNKKKAAAGGQ
ncbi:tetratricopeptide repeat protein [Compostibacter hankyongensis]|uniref:Tetratricopeptide repeat protein n=1 Tax=Compostibacter hankyongensis TaxID=1007089 RepID=A0ABP8FGG0_9BACT